jgi:hypothetical protein
MLSRDNGIVGAAMALYRVAMALYRVTIEC